MITPDYARAYIDEIQRVAPRSLPLPERPSALSRLLRRLGR